MVDLRTAPAAAPLTDPTALLDAMPDIAWLADAEGRVTHVSRSWTAFAGLGGGMTEGNGWLDFVHPDDRVRAAAGWTAVVRRPARYRVEMRLRRHDGAYRWFEVRAEPSTDEAGRLTGFAGITIELDADTGDRTEPSELRATEEALRRSEEQRRLALRAAELGTWDFHLLTGEVYWDERFKAIYGVTTDRMIYEEIVGSRVHPDDQPRLRAAVGRALDPDDADDLVDMEYRVVWPDGSVHWVQVKGEAFFQQQDDGRRATRFVGTAADVDARKRQDEEHARAEAEVLRERELLTRLIERLPVMITIYDPRMETFELNDQFRAVLGWTEEDTREADLLTLAYPDPEVRERARRHMASVEPGWAEYPVTAKDGSVVPSSWANFRVSDDRQVGIGIDLRELRRAEAALRSANEKLREADRRKDEFLAVLSHELRNPLAPIRNGVYILERAAPDSDQARRARDVIDRQAQHMARLIDDLLDVTRISRGKITLQHDRLDLNALVRGTAEDHRETFVKNGVRLEVLDAGRPLWVDGDPTRLAQVVGNLLSNSAKFTPAGGHTALCIEVGDDDRAVIRVRDDGAGLSPQMQENLFEAFVQDDRTLDRSRGGLGLGLSLVKGLVEMHGGTVRASSAGLGKGAEFTLLLPLAVPVETRPEPVDVAERKGRRVLVIEDNLDAAESLQAVLELGGHEVSVAFNGPDGVEAARRLGPEVVLCDIGLPGLDGYGVARALRAEPNVGSAYLIALSGYALDEDVQRAQEAGFDRHMAKPPQLDVLGRLLEDLDG